MKRLKSPELKVPALLTDLFYDLRDRRLLPLVALLAVAIVAVPFMLSDSSSTPPPEPIAGASGSGTGGDAHLTVVRTDPGLREPGKRLGHLHETDPFKQRYTAPVFNPGSAPTDATSTTSTSTSPSSGSNPTEGAPASGGGGATAESPSAPPNSTEHPSSSGSGDPSVKIFTFAIDVHIVRTETSDGGKKSSESSDREHVVPPATLPGEKTQVVTYIGISPKTKNALFLVSSEVTSVFGEAKCVSGRGSCQLLELEQGFPVTFVYGANDVRYKVNVVKIEPVLAGHS